MVVSPHTSLKRRTAFLLVLSAVLTQLAVGYFQIASADDPANRPACALLEEPVYSDGDWHCCKQTPKGTECQDPDEPRGRCKTGENKQTTWTFDENSIVCPGGCNGESSTSIVPYREIGTRTWKCGGLVAGEDGEEHFSPFDGFWVPYCEVIEKISKYCGSQLKECSATNARGYHYQYNATIPHPYEERTITKTGPCRDDDV